MREPSEEELQLLGVLDNSIATDDLIMMVQDLAEILRTRGHFVQAGVAQLASERLAELGAMVD